MKQGDILLVMSSPFFRSWKRQFYSMPFGILSSKTTAQYGMQILPNRVRVTGICTPGPVHAAGLLLKTNSFGSPMATVSSFILEKLAFKATKNISEVKMQKRLDELVGSVLSKSSRESLLISGAVVPGQAIKLLSLLHEIFVAFGI